MKKNMIITFAVLFSIILISGCSTEQDIKIGFSLGPSQERWEKDIDYFSSRIRDSGATLFVTKAENSHAKQVEQVLELFNKNIDVLVIVPVDSKRASEIVCMAHDYEVRVIAYDRIVNDCELDLYISFDNMRVGEMQAEYLTRIKPEGYYALLGGDPADNNSFQLRLGHMNVLQPYVESNRISIVVDQYIKNWSSEEAYKVINDYLESNPGLLDAIIASNDHLADGAFRALDKHNLSGKVLLSGQDAEVDACRRIVSGHQSMTVYKYIETLATVSANAAISLAQGNPVMNTQLSINNGSVMVPSILLSSMVSVHPENIRMTVITDGFLDEELIFVSRQSVNR